MNLERISDSELIKIAKNKNEISNNALDVLYKKYYNYLYNFSAKILKNNKQDAEDNVNDAFLNFFSNLNSFTDNNNFKAWIFEITYNSAIDKLRRRKIRDKFLKNSLNGSSYSLEEDLEKRIIKNNLHQLIKEERDSLKEKYSVVLKLSSEGWKYKEIAEKLNEDIGKIKLQIFCGKKKLKKILTDKYGRDSFYDN